VVEDLDLDLTSEDQLALLPSGAARTILTSYGGNSLARLTLVVASGGTCLGLLRPDPADPTEAAVLEGQGRLDWPIGTVAVVPDQRGSIDFPCHRWQAPASDWAVAR
jgi:hypothetical protein